MDVNTGVLEANTLRIDAPAAEHTRARKAVNAPPKRLKERSAEKGERVFRESKALQGVSLFAIFGTLIIAVLMMFVVLAQIYYNETADEAVRLSTQVRDLTERHRVLELAFESSFDIREVERIAKDELGMSRPDAAQIITVSAVPDDMAIVVVGGYKETQHGFFDFIKSLFEYFMK